MPVHTRFQLRTENWELRTASLRLLRLLLLLLLLSPKHLIQDVAQRIGLRLLLLILRLARLRLSRFLPSRRRLLLRLLLSGDRAQDVSQIRLLSALSAQQGPDSLPQRRIRSSRQHVLQLHLGLLLHVGRDDGALKGSRSQHRNYQLTVLAGQRGVHKPADVGPAYLVGEPL